jgi:hypothetical protein
VARILIVGGGCRGRQLAAEQARAGHAVRVTTRTDTNRAVIEATGAECWIGTPDRLATLRGSLESVTITCWLLAAATGARAEVSALHGSRLEFFLRQSIDSTVRGFIYEAGGDTVPREVLARGSALVGELGEHNAIPVAVLRADPSDPQAWLDDARAAVASLLAVR